MTRNSAEPAMNAPCASPANGAALPWPKRCSSSAGVRADRMATKLSAEAKRSSAESASDARTDTEQLVKYAKHLIATMSAATASDASAARRISPPSVTALRESAIIMEIVFLSATALLVRHDDRPTDRVSETDGRARIRFPM